MADAPRQPSREERISLHSGDYAATYADNHHVRIDKIIPRVALPPNAAVVDFGCGPALSLGHLKDRIAKYVGVDFSPDFISIAKSRAREMGADNAEFYCGSIESFGNKNPDRFDAVFAFDISEHVSDDEWSPIVQSAWKTLKPGGVIYLHTPNVNFIIERMKEHNFILKQFPEHIAVRTPKANAAFFIEAGFVDVKVDLISHYINVLRPLHWFAWIPIVGTIFAARIFLTARKA